MVVVAGVLSGTSVDGIDVVVVNITESPPPSSSSSSPTTPSSTNPRLTQLAFETVPYSPKIRSELLQLFSGEPLPIRAVCELNFKIGAEFAGAVASVVAQCGVDVDVVASHGQTVWHEVTPANEVTSTMQLGEASVIASKIGVSVVSDFRVADVAAGGHGAPLTSLWDYSYLRG
eukprot:TRINITY_DN13299_c0_g1_i1.p1 TRINITY_DN13299_c0_g1~~TRINITY_DN13299_c0_g1_i1.p1  ORF type:complete len:174 (+),score=29.46 TRINITY_DN13299_c0_g1_i1:52-573(+)